MTNITTSAPEGKSPALPFIHPDDMPKRYALTGRGSCMMPLIPNGALLAFDKREHPKKGDVVGIVLTPSAAVRYGMPGMIKRLVAMPPAGFCGIDESFIIVEQLSPQRSLTIRSTDVLAVHKMIGFATSEGEGRASVRLPKGGAA